uniref:TNFR-Cys domain-containing protein n=1 Tax=Denticeps clupeoides TaxID=299321 RepID=A0AAY4BCL0_9TELE
MDKVYQNTAFRGKTLSGSQLGGGWCQSFPQPGKFRTSVIDHGSIMFGYFSAACLYITGFSVSKNCTRVTATICSPCLAGKTFMNEPNGLSECLTCKSCDSGQGLMIKDKCTVTSDTVCNLHPGYYCVSYSGEGECIFGEKHQKCGPGQHVKTPGTKSANTVCEECPDGFYSTVGKNCTKWTNCAITGEEENEKGSTTKDVTCWRRSRARIGLVFPFVFIFFTLIACTLWWYLQTCRVYSRNPNNTPCPTPIPSVLQKITSESPECVCDFREINCVCRTCTNHDQE